MEPGTGPIAAARVSVVIPCHNEEDSIATVIQAVPPGAFEIIVIDNNCSDRTAEIARAQRAKVVTEKTPGYGAALKAGFRAAQGDVIAALDGDNQYPAASIRPMVEMLVDQHVDFICATRFPLLKKESMNMTRRIGNLGLTFGVNLLFGLHLRDSQSGMWVFRRSVLDMITVENDDMPLSQELKIKAALHPKIRFAEYHIAYGPRIGDSKLLSLKHGLMLLRHMCTLRPWS